jgi:hypothetical protein
MKKLEEAWARRRGEEKAKVTAGKNLPALRARW